MITFKTKCKQLYHKMFDGEITLDKSTFWLVASVIFMLGMLYGLLKAPLTHGVTISCGNNNGNNNQGVTAGNGRIGDVDENEEE